MFDRGVRRALTECACVREERKAKDLTMRRSWSIWLKSRVVRDWCEGKTPGCWAKRRTLACGCRGRHAGRPKEVRGTCKAADRHWRPAVRARIDGKREVRAILRDLD